MDCLCNRENMQEARRKSIMPHGNICKGKISFQSFHKWYLFASYKLVFALHPSKQIVFKIPHFLLFACFGRVVINHQKGGDFKENGPLAHLVWILVFDDQYNQIGLMCLLVSILQSNRMQCRLGPSLEHEENHQHSKEDHRGGVDNLEVKQGV